MARLSPIEKYRIIEPVLNKRANIGEVARQHDIPVRTLRYWKDAYLTKGIDGLKKKIRSDKDKPSPFPKEVIQMVHSLALQKPPMSISLIHSSVFNYCKESSINAPSYNWVYKQVKTIPKNLLTLAHKGTKAYRQQYEFLHRVQTGAPNEVWQEDHTLLDIWVLSETNQAIRPWLTIVLDDFSRAICGYYLSEHSPDATNTALALRQAIWKKKQPGWTICGLPQKLYTDNGPDFISDQILQVCLQLKIQLIHSLPGNPRGRGKIERFFLTLNTKLLQSLPGYSVGDKPISKPALSLKAFENKLVDFIVDYYNHHPLGRQKIIPVARWQSNGNFLPQTPSSLEELDKLLMRVDKPRKIQRDGIHFMGLRYVAITLVAFVGESVVIRYDPRDLAEIKVYFTDGVFLCKAVCQDIEELTISFRELLSARKLFNKQLNSKIKNANQFLENLRHVNKNITPTKKSPNKSPKPAYKLKLYLHE